MRISEEFRLTSTKDFKRTGSLIADARRFADFHGQRMDTPHKVGLRLALGDPLIVHQLTEGVCRKILGTRIETVPTEYPELLKTPLLIESRPGSYLFDDVHTIGTYIGDEGVFYMVLYCEFDSMVLHKKAPFDGANLSELNLVPKENGSPFKATEEHNSKAKKSLPFVTILALMLEAERSPIAVDGGSRKARKRNKGKTKPGAGDWIERRIYVDARYESRKQDADHLPRDKDGKTKKAVFVQGFLRNQPHGPKHSLRKWIYIEGFGSSRWTVGRDARVTVDVRGKAEG